MYSVITNNCFFNCFTKLYTVSGKKVLLYFCSYICQILTDIPHSFTDTLSSELKTSKLIMIKGPIHPYAFCYAILCDTCSKNSHALKLNEAICYARLSHSKHVLFASRQIRIYSTGQKAAFKRSAITPPKVNRFGWNLEYCEQIVVVWLWPAQYGSDSLRGSRNYVFGPGKQRTISPISRRKNFTKFEHNNVDRCRHVNFRNRILKILP